MLILIMFDKGTISKINYKTGAARSSKRSLRDVYVLGEVAQRAGEPHLSLSRHLSADDGVQEQLDRAGRCTSHQPDSIATLMAGNTHMRVTSPG